MLRHPKNDSQFSDGLHSLVISTTAGGRTSAAGTTEWSPFVGWFGAALAAGEAEAAGIDGDRMK